MKSMYQKVTVLVCVLVIGSLVGCGSGRGENTEKGNTIKIGVAFYRGDDAFIASVRTYLEAGIKEQEERTGKKVVVNFEEAKNSQSSQNDQVDNFINKGYDAVCVNMVDRTAAAVIIDKAKEAEIPIIFFNREPVEEDMKIWNQVYYVGSDAKEAGQMEGQIIANAYKENPQALDKNQDGKLQYVMLEGEQVHQDSLIRTEYSIKTLVGAGIEMDKLARDTGNWMRSLGYEKMLPWIGQFGSNIEVVISNNDEMALGALEALREKNMLDNGSVVVGIDGTKEGIEAVAKGEMLGTVFNDAKAQADAILGIACDAATGKNPSDATPLINGQYVRAPHKMVTKDVAEQFVEQKE